MIEYQGKIYTFYVYCHVNLYFFCGVPPLVAKVCVYLHKYNETSCVSLLHIQQPNQHCFKGRVPCNNTAFSEALSTPPSYLAQLFLYGLAMDRRHVSGENGQTEPQISDSSECT